MRRSAALLSLSFLSLPWLSLIPATAPAADVRVASWNLEWFFDEDNGDNPTPLQKSKTAPSAEEYESRVKGFAAAIAALDPHVIALQEIENESVVVDIAARLESEHSRGYEVAFVQGGDDYTGQDVAYLVKDGIDFEVDRFDFTHQGDPDFKDLSKHALLTATVDGQPLKFVAVHLITDENDRMRQARTLREWTRGLTDENLVVLGDFNVGLSFDQTQPGTDIGVIRGLADGSAADDLFDAHKKLSPQNRKTHVSDRELDRILVSRALADGQGFDLASVANRRELATRGTIDMGGGVDYGLAENEQDLSDHFPLVATFSASGDAPDGGVTHDAEAAGGGLHAAFYNVENLFDTEDDPDLEGDEEFTPVGDKGWTEERLETKLGNLSRVISAMGGGLGPDLLGLCEVENREVVDALVERLQATGRDYRVLHQESPSDRGIDCALVYDANAFELAGSAFHFVEADNTRDIGEARLNVGDESLFVFVNHWPSRNNPAAQRKAAALVLRARVDAILAADPEADVLILGDLNDHPDDPSVRTHLRAVADADALPAGALLNATATVEGPPDGTYVFDNQWEVIDHVIVSKGMLGGEGLRLRPGSAGPALLVDDQLFDPSGPAIPRPNRSYTGNNFHETGYSDHLPVSCVLDR